MNEKRKDLGGNRGIGKGDENRQRKGGMIA